MSEIIDINVYETSEDVTINVTEEVIEVNINQVSSGSIGAWGSIIGDIADQTDLQNALDLKVDKVAGKELSENDFTDILKNKLDGIAAGAEVNVNADWNSVSGDSEILNKPTIPSIAGLATVTYVDNQDALKEDDLGNPLVDGYVLASTVAGVRSWVEQSGGGGGGTWGSITGTLADQTDLQLALDNKVDKVVGKELSTNDFTDALETKLNGIEAGAEVNVNADWNAISGDSQILNKPIIPTQGITSVGLTMPVAFNVANSPLIADGTLAVTAAGTASQYIRGDGQLATLPTGSSGGSSVVYYLNGSVNSSVAGYKQMDNEAIIGIGTNFSLAGNGLIAQFLTDVGNPNRIEIPGGAWNFEMFFSVSSVGGNPEFYIDLLKYDGTTFTLISSGSNNPEVLDGGNTTDLYLTSLAIPNTALLVTDRLAVRVYVVNNSGGRTVTLHTEDNTLCEIITTFSGGVTSLNGLTANTQYLAVGTTGTDFNIDSTVDTHTFNLPTASSSNRGALSSANWTTFNGKQDALGYTPENVANKENTTLDTSTTKYPTNNLVKTNIDLKANLASPTFTGTVTTPAIVVSSETADTIASFDVSKNIKSLPVATYPSLTELSYVKGTTSAIQTQLNSKQTTLTNPITGTGTPNKIPKFTGASTLGDSQIFENGSNIGIGTISSSYPLQVATQVSNISIYANYDIVAYSDQSVKENIRPINNALDRVIKSRGILYDRIDNGSKDNIGFIAQELEFEFPELVVKNDDGTKAVKYQNAVAVLFEAIKEQQKQIEVLKELVNNLRK